MIETLKPKIALLGLFFLASCQESLPLSSESLRAPRAVGQQECGEASYYGVGDGFAGKRTASGIIMRPQDTNKAACAYDLLHDWITLECGGKSFDVQCVDRGGFRSDEGGHAYGRVLDLYAGTFSQCFGSLSSGKGRVCYRLGKKSQQVAQYCGVDNDTGKPHFRYVFQSDGSIEVSVDKRCPGTTIEMVLIDVKTSNGKSKVARESKELAFDLKPVGERKSVSIAPESIESLGGSNYTHIRFIVSNSKEAHFSTGPRVPSPPIPGRFKETQDNDYVSAFSSGVDAKGFVDGFSYDGVDLRSLFGDKFIVTDMDFWSSPSDSPVFQTE